MCLWILQVERDGEERAFRLDGVFFLLNYQGKLIAGGREENPGREVCCGGNLKL